MRSCAWCEKPLPKGRRKYCCHECSVQYFRHNIGYLWWNVAVKMARERASNKCEMCGATARLEVHHKIKLEPGEQRHNSPKNAQENLLVLCRGCHDKAHHPSILPSSA